MKRLLALAAAIALSACASAPPSAPPPSPPPPAPLAQPSRPAAPLPANWQDWPLTAGDWALRQDARGSVALFGPLGRDALFMIRCDKVANAIYLSRSGTVSQNGEAKMLIRASTAAKDYPALTNGDVPTYAAAKLSPRDAQLDAVAFSRGRFLVSVTGMNDVVIPAWPEFTRVVEDCRS